MIKQFFSCDWGSSSFRLKLVNADNLSVIAEENNNKGILATHELWQNSNLDASNRLDFYLNQIRQHVKIIEDKKGITSKGIPLVISGMASSSLGMIELPYKQLPFDISGKDIQPYKLPNHKQYEGLCMIIPGVCTNEDVMRGEETLLIGSADSSSEQDDVHIFPGTHSKHVIVKNGKAIDFKTYMTGEFFDLLSSKSILSNSVLPNNFFEKHIDSFKEGVKAAFGKNILHSSFLVRTNSLFSKCTPEQNYFYLSGLLIGAELSGLQTKDFEKLTVVANKKLAAIYEEAFKLVGPNVQIKIINADEALVRGQHRILCSLL